jgi:plastocyanin
LVLVTVATSLASCGGGGSSATNGKCGHPTTQISITAKNNLFDKTCLVAPANQAATISFRNQDGGVAHNIQVFAPNGASVFKGALFTGVKTITYHVPALKPGTYTFHCDVHPDSMKGTFVVR